MSSSVYWQQVTPDEPLGSWQQLKWLLFDEGNRPAYGEKSIIKWDSPKRVWLEGWLAGRPDGSEEGAQFLADLKKYGQLEVWIDG